MEGEKRTTCPQPKALLTTHSQSFFASGKLFAGRPHADPKKWDWTTANCSENVIAHSTQSGWIFSPSFCMQRFTDRNKAKFGSSRVSTIWQTVFRIRTWSRSWVDPWSIAVKQTRCVLRHVAATVCVRRHIRYEGSTCCDHVTIMTQSKRFVGLLRLWLVQNFNISKMWQYTRRRGRPWCQQMSYE